jgi:hypothetical protein
MLAGVNEVMAGAGLLVELPPEPVPVEEEEEDVVEPPPPQPERINREPRQEAKPRTVNFSARHGYLSGIEKLFD